jgi:hypothetical protein
MAAIYIRDENLKDYLYTLEICKKELPDHSHPAHYERLDNLIDWIKWELKKIHEL